MPINRIVAFVGPVIAVVAGWLADFLITKTHVGGVFRDRDQVISGISQIMVFTVTATLTWLGQQKWLSGWQQFEFTSHNEAMMQGPPGPPGPVGAPGPVGETGPQGPQGDTA